MCCLGNRPIFEVARSAVFALDDPTAQVAGDLARAVGGAGIGDQHFSGHLLRRCDACANMVVFVLTRNNDGDSIYLVPTLRVGTRFPDALRRVR
jgi:hypothetical protein